MKKKYILKLIAYYLTCGIIINGYISKNDEILNIFSDGKDNNNVNDDTTIYTEYESATEEMLETFVTETVNSNNINDELDCEITNNTEITEIPTEEFTEIVETSEPEEVEQNKGTINSDGFLYANNNDRSLKIKNLSINDSVIKILEFNNGWHLVRNNDCIGFIKEDNVLYNENEDLLNTYNHVIKKDIVLTSSQVNFRKGPDTTFDIIDTFDSNQELEVIAETDNNWLMVRLNGFIGYVCKDYTISILDKLNQTYPDLNYDSLEVNKIVYPICELNVRESNTTESNSLGLLEQYESVKVIDEYDDWYLILTNNYNFGFVSKEYVKDLNDIFVEIDLSDQRMRLYNDNNLYYLTPVTTGKASTPSDKGLFKIHWQSKDSYITDKNFCKFWMNYNSANEGIHDASWRKVYGKMDYVYNGSNGCINTPLPMAEKFYNNVNVGTKVLVHK